MDYKILNKIQDMITRKDIAEEFGVSVRTTYTWNLPEPDFVFAKTQMWYHDTILNWKNNNQRLTK